MCLPAWATSPPPSCWPKWSASSSPTPSSTVAGCATSAPRWLKPVPSHLVGRHENGLHDAPYTCKALSKTSLAFTARLACCTFLLAGFGMCLLQL